MKNQTLAACSVSILVVLIGCGKPGAEPIVAKTVSPNVLAEIGSTTITKQDFNREIERRGRRPATETERSEWFREMVRLETLYANARADGIEQDLEIQLALKKMVVGKYLDRRQRARPIAEISTTEVEEYYHANHAEFMQPARARFAVIFLKISAKATPEKTTEMLARAERIHQAAAAQPNFGALAEQSSEDNGTRYQGGDAGYLVAGLQPGRWPSNVVETVFALTSVGQISPIISAEDGFYILKLIQRENASTRPLADVEPVIRRRLIDSAARTQEEQFMANEELRAGVVLHLEALEQIAVSHAALAQRSALPVTPQ